MMGTRAMSGDQGCWLTSGGNLLIILRSASEQTPKTQWSSVLEFDFFLLSQLLMLCHFLFCRLQKPHGPWRKMQEFSLHRGC
ncbi:hypothetical protein CapIbe_023719 [Capra ibex]